MTDEELLDQYVHGNHETVKAELAKLEPLDAAATAVKLYQELQNNDDVLEFSHDTAKLFARRLTLWSQP